MSWDFSLGKGVDCRQRKRSTIAVSFLEIRYLPSEWNCLMMNYLSKYIIFYSYICQKKRHASLCKLNPKDHHGIMPFSYAKLQQLGDVSV